MQTKNTDNTKWYVLVTKPKAEKQVSKRLTQSSVENFLPQQRQLRIWHDRKKWVEIPLFGSYIFVKIQDNLRYKVFNISGILKYVSSGGRACVLTGQEIERVKRLCNYSEPITVEQTGFEKEDEIEISDGYFAGFRGRVVESEGRCKLKLAVAGLNFFATVTINKNIARKVGN